ncbi:MAG: tetratricopeptide repeat protein, partial [Candidatus Riflebacteria bacterium]|nr:tetratricopeptide repeat protein [Candidatus Riflebacteria bacterium]
KKSLKDSIIFLIFFIVQIGVILMLNRIGNIISLAFMALIWVWSKWFNYSGKISRKSPLIAGFLIAIILFAGQWYIYSKTSSYQWDKITFLPAESHPFVTRVILWQMGFDIFKEHPKTGTGAGSISYIMPLKRPPTASTLGLAIHNPDPHSFIVTTLAETGFLGLWGVCSILAAVFGIYVRKYSRYESVEETTEDNSNKVSFPWAATLTTIIIIVLGFKAGFINQNILPIIISLVILFFGICTSFLNNSYRSNKNDYLYIGKSTLTAVLAFAFYSLFNNSFSIFPLIGLVVSIIGLHFSCCQPDVVYKPRITLISLTFIFLPVIYGFSSCHFQHSYNQEQLYLSLGNAAFEKDNWELAEQYFLKASNINPQCLQAYHGRALSLDAMGKTEEAQDVLSQLDAMVPNIYNVKYEIARILFESHKILEAHRYAVNNLKWIETPLSYELFGRILLEEGRYSEAEEVFKEGLINIPNSQKEIIAADRIRLNLAALNSNRGNYAECKKYLNEIKTEIGEHLEYLYMKGMILNQEKKYNEALEIFEKALRQYPTVPKILNAVGYLLMITNKDLDRAEVILEKAYELSKQSQPVDLAEYLMISNSLGKLYQKQNKLTQAGELLKNSYEGTPDEWKSLKESRLKDLNDFYDSFGKAE